MVAPADEGLRASAFRARTGEAASGALTLRRSRGYAPAALSSPSGRDARSSPRAPSSRRPSASPVATGRSSRRIWAIWSPSRRCAPSMPTSSSTWGCSAPPPRWSPTTCIPATRRRAGPSSRTSSSSASHHHAHAAACLAEHGAWGPALAVVFDGTATAPTPRCGAARCCAATLTGYERVAHLEAVPLPGGEAAIRQPWRMAAVHLERAGRPVPYARWPEVRTSLRVNAPPSSGMGRLFDAVAALAGLRDEVSYEGQAAIELEELAGDVEAAPYPCRVADGVLHGSDLVAAVHDNPRPGAGAPRSPPPSTRAWRRPPRRPACRPRSRVRSSCREAPSRTAACAAPCAAGSRPRASRCSATAACRPTTAGSATDRRPSPPQRRGERSSGPGVFAAGVSGNARVGWRA